MKELSSLVTIFLIFLLLNGCENKNILQKDNKDEHMEIKKMNIIYYGSKNFKEFVNKQPKISLNKAWEIHQKHYNKKLDEDIVRVNFIIDNYYVFSKDVNYKLMQASMSGLWVHSDTGKVIVKNENKLINLYEQEGWSYPIVY
jgi:hypothetical protein